MKWTEELDNRLKDHIAAGKSRSWIANDFTFTLKIHCTRNMVVGRAYRIGLASPFSDSVRSTIGNETKRKKRGLPSRTKQEIVNYQFLRKAMWGKRLLKLDPSAPVPLLIPTSDLKRHHCRDVIGTDTADNLNRLHCGHHAEGSSWCDYHHAKYLRKYVRRSR